ncbi:glycosyltransferase family 4 protein, partial [Patescibacteria group bacterium]
VAAALKFGERVLDIAKRFDGDLVHSHDWLTFPAGMVSKSVIGKPLVAHVHATEIDRTGGHYPNPDVFEIEKRGLSVADRVISVSEFTKNNLVQHYALSPKKISVVHNGVTEMENKEYPEALSQMKKLGYKIVLYHGRITLQKGPEYFIYAAKKVLDYKDKVLFVVSGSGDMQGWMMEEAARLGIMERVIFAGALWGDDAYRMMQSADLLVMPSVSEPFGIVPLEAVANKTPTLISKQSGVSEVLKNCLRVDFWDVDEMANKIIALLSYKELGSVIVKESEKELPNINWEKAAGKVLGVYNQLV